MLTIPLKEEFSIQKTTFNISSVLFQFQSSTLYFNKVEPRTNEIKLTQEEEYEQQFNLGIHNILCRLDKNQPPSVFFKVEDFENEIFKVESLCLSFNKNQLKSNSSPTMTLKKPFLISDFKKLFPIGKELFELYSQEIKGENFKRIYMESLTFHFTKASIDVQWRIVKNNGTQMINFRNLNLNLYMIDYRFSKDLVLICFHTTDSTKLTISQDNQGILLYAELIKCNNLNLESVFKLSTTFKHFNEINLLTPTEISFTSILDKMNFKVVSSSMTSIRLFSTYFRIEIDESCGVYQYFILGTQNPSQFKFIQKKSIFDLPSEKPSFIVENVLPIVYNKGSMFDIINAFNVDYDGELGGGTILMMIIELKESFIEFSGIIENYEIEMKLPIFSRDCAELTVNGKIVFGKFSKYDIRRVLPNIKGKDINFTFN
jgi:hypothetical protein